MVTRIPVSTCISLERTPAALTASGRLEPSVDVTVPGITPHFLAARPFSPVTVPLTIDGVKVLVTVRVPTQQT